MRISISTVLVICMSILGTAHAEDAAKVGSLLEDWRDAERDRVVPVKIDYPSTIDKPVPVIVISHGLGGSREGLAYIGRYWAAHGYVAVHLQHQGSDESVWKNLAPQDAAKAMKDAMSTQQFVARIRDVVFALDELEKRNKDPHWRLSGKLNLNEIAMAGHSFGAITTQAMCGELFAGARNFGDGRVKAGIVLSPSPPANGDPKAAFSKIAMPIFYWTGTRDESPSIARSVKPTDRRVPFDSSAASDQYLVILDGGDHMVFNGTTRQAPADRPDDPAWHHLIEVGTTAFLDKYLKSDHTQAAYLDGGGFAGEAKPLGTFEKRTPGK